MCSVLQQMHDAQCWGKAHSGVACNSGRSWWSSVRIVSRSLVSSVWQEVLDAQHRLHCLCHRLQAALHLLNDKLFVVGGGFEQQLS